MPTIVVDMKHKINNKLMQNVTSLAKKINNEKNPDRKAYLLLKMYLLLSSIQSTYLINKSDNAYFDDLFKSCVNLLTRYFKCNPMTLPSHILSTVGREVIPFFNAIDRNEAQRLLYFTREEANNFKVAIHEGKVFYQNPENEFEQNDEEREFVFSFSGDIYVKDGRIADQFIEHDNQFMKHSSFLSGDEVLCAGMIKIVDNKITEVSNSSGHYRPSHKDIAIFLNHLQLLGVDLSTVQLKLLLSTEDTLETKADLFLKNYPQLQLLKNTSFDSHQKIRRKDTTLNKIFDLIYKPSEKLKPLFEDVDNKRSEYVEKGKTNPDENSELVDYFYKLWSDNFSLSPESLESLALIHKIKSVDFIDHKLFKQKLRDNGFEALHPLANDPRRNIEGETYTVSSDVDSEILNAFILNLKVHIIQQPWETTFRIGLFGKAPKPSHVQAILDQIELFETQRLDPIKTYEEVLKIAQSAINKPDWRRKESTQQFYEKLVCNELLEDFRSSEYQASI
ncbi:hypothetical protein Lnau_0812 [Legionella nautarum]|uniref:Uncharacterized protein n=2 Tax=Legionella nautarum TaxID=45070 RepID=A0A0W0WU63_9GAMM|nr:hypothetical protein Lnau_0812 [Legionella nautarum]